MKQGHHYQVSVEGQEETIMVEATSPKGAIMVAVMWHADVFSRMGWPRLKARRMSEEEVRMATEFPSEEVK